MHPSFGTIPILDESLPAYFTMLVLGFAVATWVGVRWAKRSGLDHEVIIDLGLFSLIAGVIGGRLLHVVADGFFWDYVHLCTDPSLVEWPFSEAECSAYEGVWDVAAAVCRPKERDCFAWAAFWNGGLAYYGGLVSGTAYGLWFLKREKFPIAKALDMGGMTIPIGLFFGRLGCFLGGCCFGIVTDHALGVSFPAGSAASREQAEHGLLPSVNDPSLPVHPTQLYEAIGCLAIAALAILVVHPKKRFDGVVFLFTMSAYAVLRFLVEMLRADDRGALLGLSTSQLIGVGILIACAFAWPRLRKRSATA